MLLIVTSTRMNLMLRWAILRTSTVRMIGARLRAAKIFWPTSFVLWLCNPVSMRFLAPSRAFHLTDRILLMRHRAIVGTAIMGSARACGYDFPAVKVSGPRGGGDCRSPMVLGSQEGPIVARLMLMPHLQTCGFKVAFPSPSLLFMSRTSTDSAVASVIADAIHRDVIDHSSVVDMHVSDPDVVDAAVVVEVPTSPVSARIASANIAETIINAAVETDMRSPITRIPDINTLMPTPIARRP